MCQCAITFHTLFCELITAHRLLADSADYLLEQRDARDGGPLTGNTPPRCHTAPIDTVVVVVMLL